MEAQDEGMSSEAVVHDVVCCTSVYPSSRGVVNAKAVASVPTSPLLTSVIK